MHGKNDIKQWKLFFITSIRQNKTKSKIETDYGQCFIHIPKQVRILISILEVSKVLRFLLFQENVIK